jgi:hypothetical protein
MLLVFLWLQFPRFAASAPIAITNGQQFTSWQSEPPIRGTFSLLTNCLITLTLCVWTAVHLNIVAEKSPEEQSGFLQRISNSVKFRKLKWVLLGLLAPELVVYTAWRQWSSAQELTREMQRILVEVSHQKTIHAQLPDLFYSEQTRPAQLQ